MPAPGIAIREYQTDVGPADYVLFVDKKGHRQSSKPNPPTGGRISLRSRSNRRGYAEAKLKWINDNEPLPFLYESTEVITRFTDARDPRPSLPRGLQFSPAGNAEGMADP